LAFPAERNNNIASSLLNAAVMFDEKSRGANNPNSPLACEFGVENAMCGDVESLKLFLELF